MADISLIVQTASGGQTTVKDYSDIVSEVEVAWERLDHPGEMSFTCIEDSYSIPEGSSVELQCDSIKMFKGYIFTIEQTMDGKVSYKAYDQLRYLKNEDSLAFENETLAQIVQKIAGRNQLQTGNIPDTGYAFPAYVKESETGLDIIFDALSETIVQTGKIWLFYDDYGKLTLSEAKDLLVRTVIGDGSLATDYTYKRDIDSDCYNRIKLVRKNEKTGKTDAYVHEDTDAIKKIGLLQYYDEVDESLNEAQIDAMCKAYLQYYNRVQQTITIDSIGVPEVRAGSIVPVHIGAVPDLAVTRLLLVEKVTHKFKEGVHTMELEVKNFDGFGGMEIV